MDVHGPLQPFLHALRLAPKTQLKIVSANWNAHNYHASLTRRIRGKYRRGDEDIDPRKVITLTNFYHPRGNTELLYLLWERGGGDISAPAGPALTGWFAGKFFASSVRLCNKSASSPACAPLAIGESLKYISLPRLTGSLLDLRLFGGPLGMTTRGVILWSELVITTRPCVWWLSASCMISWTSVEPTRIAGDGGRLLSQGLLSSTGSWLTIVNLTCSGGRGRTGSSKMSNCHPGGWDPAAVDCVVFSVHSTWDINFLGDLGIGCAAFQSRWSLSVEEFQPRGSGWGWGIV